MSTRCLLDELIKQLYYLKIIAYDDLEETDHEYRL